MRTLVLCFTLAATAALSACADRATHTRAIMAPERDARLSKEERDALHPGIDTGALERLLDRVPPEQRGQLLAYFRRGSRAGIIGAADPESDALVRQVWAPLGGVSPGNEVTPPGAARRVEVALVPELDDPLAGARVLREAHGGRDLIVLPERHATAAQLFLAHGALMKDRRDHGTVPGAERTFTVRPMPPLSDSPRQQATARMLEREYGPHLQRLRQATHQSVPGIGRARVMVLQPDTPPGS